MENWLNDFPTFEPPSIPLYSFNDPGLTIPFVAHSTQVVPFSLPLSIQYSLEVTGNTKTVYRQSIAHNTRKAIVQLGVPVLYTQRIPLFDPKGDGSLVTQVGMVDYGSSFRHQDSGPVSGKFTDCHGRFSFGYEEPTVYTVDSRLTCKG